MSDKWQRKLIVFLSIENRRCVKQIQIFSPRPPSLIFGYRRTGEWYDIRIQRLPTVQIAERIELYQCFWTNTPDGAEENINAVRNEKHSRFTLSVTQFNIYLLHANTQINIIELCDRQREPALFFISNGISILFGPIDLHVSLSPVTIVLMLISFPVNLASPLLSVLGEKCRCNWNAMINIDKKWWNKTMCNDLSLCSSPSAIWLFRRLQSFNVESEFQIKRQIKYRMIEMVINNKALNSGS